MRNKIFLTSIIAMMVVNAPAFAQYPYGFGTYDTDNNGTLDTGYIGALLSAGGNAVTSAACDASPLMYYDGQTPDHGTFTFEAQWEQRQFNIIFNKRVTDAPAPAVADITCTNSTHCTSGTMNSQSVAFGEQSVTLRQNYYSAPGWTFVGWVGDHNNGSPSFSGTSANAGNTIGSSTPVSFTSPNTYNGTPYADEATFSNYNINGNLNLYAKWSPIGYTITYDCNCTSYGNDCEDSNPPVDSDTHTVVETSVPLASNDTSTQCNVTQRQFQGWSCYKADDSSVPVSTSGNPGSQVITGSFPAYNVKCDANWSAAGSLEISYDCGDVGGTAPSSSHPQYGGSWSLEAVPGQGCTSTGYTFTGWQCTNNIGGTAVSGTPNYPVGNNGSVSALGNNYDINGDTVCTAQWDQNQITLIWNPNGGNPVPHPTTTCMYGDGAGTAGGIGGNTNNGDPGVEQPTRDGYTFKGWKVSTHSNN